MPEYERLKNVVTPVFYDILISVDLNLKTFNGILTIEIDVKGDTDCFQLNGHNLMIKSALLNCDTEALVTYCKELQTIEFKFENKLPLSKNILKIVYEGQLSVHMKGFYHSSYKCDDGSIEDIAVTHFEPTNARYAFPCWDEPAYRTPFKIAITTEKGYTAVSNMPVTRRFIVDGMETFEFEITPQMSTYLVAFAIGHFEQKKLKGTDISVYCRKGTTDNLAAYALEVANKALTFYNRWFNIEYNLPKLDMLAVPDFQGGAMENWGLIIFRERALLVSEENTSMSMKQSVALTISHEIAHMWFGNFVTMEWWTDLWLKEGFATWIEYLCVEHCFPNYEIWNQCVINEYFRTLKLDSLMSTHPIEVEVKSPEEISEIFDTISYAKGASVIRMLYDYLGEEDFQKGLRAYLQTYKFKCTKTEDLWNSLQSCTDKSVKEVMHSWTRQSGYPLLTVTMNFSLNGDAIESIKLIQNRYIQSGELFNDKVLWHIPITIVSAENPSEEVIRFIMKDKEHIVNLKNLDKSYKSVLINPSAIGIYRVKYADKDILNSLKQCLSLASWNSINKFSLIEDCFSLANSGDILYTNVLDMLDFLKTEQSYMLWQMVDSNFSDIHYLLEESEHGVDLINKFITDIAMPSYNRLGWLERATDSHNDVLLRPLIISLLSKVKHPDVRCEALKIYNGLMDCGENIPANIRKVVYSTVCNSATEKEFKQLTERFLSSISDDERTGIIIGLGKVPMVLQDRFKDWLMSDTVRQQDKMTGLVASSGASPLHREFIWNLMKSQWIVFREMFSGQFVMGVLLNECLGKFSSLTKVKEIENFFENNESTSPRSLKQAMEKIKNNDNRKCLHVEKVHSYLQLKYNA